MNFPDIIPEQRIATTAPPASRSASRRSSPAAGLCGAGALAKYTAKAAEVVKVSDHLQAATFWQGLSTVRQNLTRIFQPLQSFAELETTTLIHEPLVANIGFGTAEK